MGVGGRGERISPADAGWEDRETETVVRWMMDALVDAALRESK